MTFTRAGSEVSKPMSKLEAPSRRANTLMNVLLTPDSTPGDLSIEIPLIPLRMGLTRCQPAQRKIARPLQSKASLAHHTVYASASIARRAEISLP